MGKRIYRLTMVVWRDCQNTDTDYIKDFSTLESATDYVAKNRQQLLQDSLDYDEYQAVDIDIEEWICDELDEYEPIEEIGVVWSTELWAKEELRTKNFIEEIKKILSNRVHNCADLIKVYEHRHEMFDDQDIINHFENACEEYAKDKGWEIEWGVDKALKKIRGYI